MDQLDPTRVIIVESIATLENAIERLMPAQAPRSTHSDVRQGADQLRAVVKQLIQHAEAVESALERPDQNDG